MAKFKDTLQRDFSKCLEALFCHTIFNTLLTMASNLWFHRDLLDFNKIDYT